MAKPTASTSNSSKGVIGWNVAPEQAQFDNSPLAAANHPRLLNRGPISAAGPRFTSMNNIKRTASDAFLSMEDDSELAEGADDDDDADSDDEAEEVAPSGKKKNPRKRNATSTGRRKIAISYIPDKSKRHVSFTKRKAGLMKKGFELSTLTGTDVLILVVSETGVVYTYATPGLKPVVDHERGKQVVADSLRGELGPDSKSQAPPSAPASQRQANMEIDLPTSAPSFEDQHSNSDSHPLGLLSLPSHYDPSLFAPQATASAHSSLSPFPSPGVNALPPLSSASPHLNAPLGSHPFPSFPPMPSPGVTTTHQLPPLLGNTSPGLSSFERAQLTHQQAFNDYHARLSSEIPLPLPSTSLPSPPATVPAHTLPSHHLPTVERGRDTSLNNGLSALQKIMTDSLAGLAMGGFEAAFMEEEENHARLAKQAKEALFAARFEREAGPPASRIHSFLSAYLAGLKAKKQQTKTEASDLNERIFERLDAFAQTRALGSVEELERFVGEFVVHELPAHGFSEKRVSQARSQLILFFDFLEQNEVIAEHELDLLSQFRAANHLATRPTPTSNSGPSSVPSTGLSAHSPNLLQALDLPSEPRIDPGSELAAQARAQRVGELVREWVPRAQKKHGARIRNGDPCGVRGWFEVYRVRKGFVLLREGKKGMQGDPCINGLLSPFKVLMPKRLTSRLRGGDQVNLGLKQLTDGMWIPLEYEGFEPREPSGPDGPASDAESEIDLAAFQTELARLEALPAAEEAIRRQKGWAEMMERAVELLAQGGGEEDSAEE